MTRCAPPRLASWLLQRCAAGHCCESLAGDLIEEYHAGRSRAWYWRQVLLAIAAGAGQRMCVESRCSADMVPAATAATIGRHNLIARRWREYRSLLLFVLLMCSFRSAWADWVYVPTGSMNPTILEGDRLLIDKHVYGMRVPFSLIHLTHGDDPNRGDIVVFDSPRDGTSLVKRVIALPGDSVALDGERLIVNGVAASYAAGDASGLRRLLRATRQHDPAVVRESGRAARPRHSAAAGSTATSQCSVQSRCRRDVLRARRQSRQQRRFALHRFRASAQHRRARHAGGAIA